MIRLLSKKIVMVISILALVTGMHAVEDTSANATTASRTMTALASAGIFASVAATTMNSFASQLPQYKNDRMQQHVLIAVPAALVTFGAMTYLCKSARSWKAILSSLVGSTTLALSGLLFGASCCEIASHSAAVGSCFYYVLVPSIIAGSAIFGYLMQPKQEATYN